jgi:co-chaperonin GroES (HSP10)
MNVVQGKLIPIRDNVLITDMNFEEQKTASGIVIRSDDGKSEGVKPRWGKVWAIGKDQKDVQVGEWILIEHGRWTRGVTVRGNDGNEFVIRRVDTKAILLSTDEQPNDFYSGQHSTPAHGSTHSPEDFVRPHY